MAKQFEVYVQGKYYKTFETDDSMSIIWQMTDLLSLATVNNEIPWYDRSKPSRLKVEPEDFDVDIKGVSEEDAE